MLSRKQKRHSGYITPRLSITWKEILENDLFVDDYYDDWEDHRDSYREWYTDFKTIKKINRRHLYWEEMYYKRIKMNKKQIKLRERRLCRKNIRLIK